MASGKVMGIVAWSVAGVLGLGMIGALVMGQMQSGRAAGLEASLSELLVAAGGEEELDAAALKDEAQRAEIVQKAQEALQGLRTELTAAEEGVAAARAAAEAARAEASTASQRAQEQEGAVETLKQELAAREEALSAAQAEGEQALEQARKEKAAAEAEREALRAQMEEKIREMQEELTDTRAAEAEEGGEVAAAPKADLTTVIAEVLAEVKEMEEEMERGRFIGPSQMFSQIQYSEDRTLFFRLLDGQTLTYHDVPPEVVANLAESGDRLDVTYRFRIQGEYKCLPPDRVVIRKYWKWLRRHRTRGEVRHIEPEPAEAPAVEAGGEAS